MHEMNIIDHQMHNNSNQCGLLSSRVVGYSQCTNYCVFQRPRHHIGDLNSPFHANWHNYSRPNLRIVNCCTYLYKLAAYWDLLICLNTPKHGTFGFANNNDHCSCSIIMGLLQYRRSCGVWWFPLQCTVWIGYCWLWFAEKLDIESCRLRWWILFSCRTHNPKF